MWLSSQVFTSKDRAFYAIFDIGLKIYSPARIGLIGFWNEYEWICSDNIIIDAWTGTHKECTWIYMAPDSGTNNCYVHVTNCTTWSKKYEHNWHEWSKANNWCPSRWPCIKFEKSFGPYIKKPGAIYKWLYPIWPPTRARIILMLKSYINMFP